jgi:hypothetical protein
LLIEPCQPKAGQGRQPLYFLQQWFNLPDPQVEDTIYGQRIDAAFRTSRVGR